MCVYDLVSLTRLYLVTLTSSSFIVNNFLYIYQNYVMYDISFNNNFASQNK